MSGDVLIPNLLVKMCKTFASSDIACSSSALLGIKTPMSGRCLDGVCGCLRVSGSYLGVSGICLGEYRCHINHKQLNGSRHIAFSPSDLPRQKVLYFGVSVGSLWGVWRVSVRCLEGVWVTLNTVWGVIMPNQLIKVHWASF